MSNSADGVEGGVQSVDRAVDVLHLLEVGDLGVGAIASELGVHKSTAFRLVATLEAHELVEPTGDGGRFRLGNGILRLAAATAVRLDLVQESRPVTARLAQRVRQTVNVVTMSGGHALYLDQVAGSATRQAQNWVGQRIPLHATSNGKVLLSELPAERLDELLAEPLAGFTPYTVTDADELRAQLGTVRRRGYAVAVDELEVGLTAVAAPVRAADGSVVGSLSASGATQRIPPAVVDQLADEVVAAAAEVSARLGWAAARRA